MKTYTKNEVEAVMLAGYRRGLEDGRMPRDRLAELRPPTIEELGIKHPLTSSNDEVVLAHKRPWLDGIGPTKK